MATQPSGFFRQPQTYLLLAGAGLGYVALLFFAGFRPLTWVAGGSISAAMVGTWAAGFRGRPDASTSGSNLLEGESFAQQLQQFDQKVPQKGQMTWRQARTWATDSQKFAERIYAQDPLLQVELLEAMHTVLDLARQVAEALQVMDQIETPTYRQLAQQRLDASCDRLQSSHAQLQQLQDQVALTKLDQSASTDKTLPQRLQTLVAANKQILESPNADPP
jgi:hypothetical protein